MENIALQFRIVLTPEISLLIQKHAIIIPIKTHFSVLHCRAFL